MAPSPFRRRKPADSLRNLAIAEAALALAKDRVGRGSRRPSGRMLLLGGAVAAAGAAVLLKRDKVAGLLPSRSGEPEHAVRCPTPPQPSNYDVRGPVANTATPIPAPDPHGEPPATIDEADEEAAAAAEAAAIGGSSSDYAGPELGEPADEAHRPLAEAGEGEAEGQEQAEAELADNATYRDAGHERRRAPDRGGHRAGRASPSRARRPSRSPRGPRPMPEPAEVPGGGISGRPYAGLEQSGEEDAGANRAGAVGRRRQRPSPRRSRRRRPPTRSPDEDGGSDDWRTWSGRSVNPLA